MDNEAVCSIVERFLASKTLEIGVEVSLAGEITEHPFGWGFYYQSKSYLEHGNFEDRLVGQGANVILNDGRILEGGSLQPTAEAVLDYYGIA